MEAPQSNGIGSSVALSINDPAPHVPPPPPPRPQGPRSQRSLQRLATTVGQSLSARSLLRSASTQAAGAAGHPTNDAQTPPNGAQYGGILPPFMRMVSLIANNAQAFGRGQASDAVEKFRCFICFDDADVTEAVALSTCGHRYCESCFQSYLGVQINDGHVHPVCFHPLDQEQEDGGQKTCGVAVSDAQIESIVDADVWAKFNRFRFTQEHEHARECPYCSHTQECTGPSNPTCVCAQCTKTFCFFHGNAHEDGTCADYELKNAETDASSRAKIDEIAKPCPGCKRDVEKDGGCNHMKCVACETSFCWLCGEEIDDSPTPEHFKPDSESACSGKQFDGMDAMADVPSWVIAYGVVVGLLCWPFAFVITLVIMPFAWCLPSSESKQDKIFFWHFMVLMFLMVVVSIVVGLVAFVVGIAFSIVKLPFRAVAYVGQRLCGCPGRGASPEEEDSTTSASTEQTQVDLEEGRGPEEPAKADATVDDKTPQAAVA